MIYLLEYIGIRFDFVPLNVMLILYITMYSMGFIMWMFAIGWNIKHLSLNSLFCMIIKGPAIALGVFIITQAGSYLIGMLLFIPGDHELFVRYLPTLYVLISPTYGVIMWYLFKFSIPDMEFEDFISKHPLLYLIGQHILVVIPALPYLIAIEPFMFARARRTKKIVKEICADTEREEVFIHHDAEKVINGMVEVNSTLDILRNFYPDIGIYTYLKHRKEKPYDTLKNQVLYKKLSLLN